MHFKEELSQLINEKNKERVNILLNSFLLKAYNQGWNDCLWGDEAPSLDSQSEKEILSRIKKEPNNKIRMSNWERSMAIPSCVPVRLKEKYQKAIRFAGEKHGDQKMPGSTISYMVHVSNVAMEILSAYFSQPDFDVDFAVQVALLHDVIEDTDTGYEELKTAFSERIAYAVLALSKNKDIPDKSERMKDSLKRILHLENEAGMVKLADRITNLQPPPKHWTKEKIGKYHVEVKYIRESLKHCNVYLSTRLQEMIESYQIHIAINS
nr:HD domain-containing protein [uncultured Draconibacterium sp.]